ncbi:MAG: hypothetical protein JHC88_11915 [Niveispirillum sp.]|nr:hypothetical protein [Niveispirillum sp.]
MSEAVQVGIDIVKASFNSPSGKILRGVTWDFRGEYEGTLIWTTIDNTDPPEQISEDTNVEFLRARYRNNYYILNNYLYWTNDRRSLILAHHQAIVKLFGCPGAVFAKMSFYSTVNMTEKDDTQLHFYNAKILQERVPSMIVLKSWAKDAAEYIQLPTTKLCSTPEEFAKLEKDFEILKPPTVKK